MQLNIENLLPGHAGFVNCIKQNSTANFKGLMRSFNMVGITHNCADF